MAEFFAMGGYGVYVWSAVGMSVAVLIWNWFSARRQMRKAREELANWLSQEETG